MTQNSTSISKDLPQRDGSVIAQQPISGVRSVEHCLVSGNGHIGGGFTKIESSKKAS